MIKIAVVGTGIIGVSHLKAIKSIPDFELCALCDLNEEVVAKLAEENSVPYFTDYHDIPKSVDVDAVILNLPHFLHCESTVFFLNAGINVLIEKPMATTLSECEEMIDASRKNNKKLAVGHIQRFINANRIVKEMIDKKKLGKLCMFSEIRTIDYFTSWRPKWFLDKKRAGGGIVMNYGAHVLDKLFYLTGEKNPLIYSSYSNAKNNYDIEGHAQIFLKFPSGFSSTITFCGYNYSGYDSIYYFTNGTIKVADTTKLSYNTGDGWIDFDTNEDDDYMRKQLVEFYKYLVDEKSDIATDRYGKSVIEAIEKIYQDTFDLV